MRFVSDCCAVSQLFQRDMDLKYLFTMRKYTHGRKLAESNRSYAIP
jgi:hypothetical protein